MYANTKYLAHMWIPMYIHTHTYQNSMFFNATRPVVVVLTTSIHGEQQCLWRENRLKYHRVQHVVIYYGLRAN